MKVRKIFWIASSKDSGLFSGQTSWKASNLDLNSVTSLGLGFRVVVSEEKRNGKDNGNHYAIE